MCMRSRPMPPAPSKPARSAAPRRPVDPATTAARLGLDHVPRWLDYVPRGRGECVYANVRLASRVVGAIYDEALEPSGLKASQLALLWAIVAMEPVEMSALGRETATDQTTLSRTVRTLERQRLVSVRTGEDRRVKLLRLTARGRACFAAALPHWEQAQARVAEVLAPERLLAAGREIRRSRRAGA